MKPIDGVGRSPSVRIGSRGSKLSLWQARWVAERLGAALPRRSIEIVPIVTRGDVNQGPLTDLSESGVFTSELEFALGAGRVDVAVHSLKDLPVDAPGGFPIVAVPLRGDPADALVRRIDEGTYDAIVLAVAGLARLGLEGRISERLDPRRYPPAPGQGALAVQVREGDAELHAVVVAMDDPEARSTITAERTCLSALGGGCSMPVGAHAWWSGGELHMAAFVGSPDGKTILRASRSGTVPESVGQAAAEALLAQGAGALLG